MAEAKTNKRPVFGKILAVMGDISHIIKDGKHGMGYKYTSEYQVLATIRKSMVKHGLVIIPSLNGVESVDAGQTKAGQLQRLSVVQMKYTFIDADTGDMFEANFAGQGMDVGDKGIYKAMTGCNKYALLKSFQLPTGDDPEADELTDTDNAPVRKSMPRQEVIARIKKAEGMMFKGDKEIVNARMENIEVLELDEATDTNLNKYRLWLGSKYREMEKTNKQEAA